VIALLTGAALFWLARRTMLARLGLALFLFFLVPAFNVAAFPREQAVHDRYLYLSLLGFLMLVVPPLWEWAEARVKVLALAGLGLLCVGLGGQTVRYNRAWLNGVALFQRGIQTDPTATINHDSLAAEYTEQKRWGEALASYNEALKYGQQSSSYAGRAQVLTELQRYDEAERDLQEIITKRSDENQYTLYQAYERLAICYQRQNKLDEAVQTLTDARTKLPMYYAALTEKMSVVLYQAKKQDVAVAQLESARPYARRELLPESRLVLHRLGLLYMGFNKPKEARAALVEYLNLTNEMQDPITNQYRLEAKNNLQKLGGQ
jgi:tetratricopeptide (TPR) repeat protein